MYLDVFDRNPFGTNCWLLAADGSDDAVVVDPGFEPREVRSLLERAGKRPVAVLLTHAHIDHAYAAGDFADDDVPVFIHQDDAVAFEDIEAWGSGFDNPLTPAKIFVGSWAMRSSRSRAFRSGCGTRRGTPPATAAS